MDLPIDINLILYFLLALLIIAVAGMLALLFLVNRWRKHADQALLQLGSELNTIGMQIEALQAVQQEYGALHRQPYTELADELRKKDHPPSIKMPRRSKNAGMTYMTRTTRSPSRASRPCSTRSPAPTATRAPPHPCGSCASASSA